MISISSSSMDELKSCWRKLEGEYQLVEKIHLDPKQLEYKMIISKLSKEDISPVLKSIAEKVFEADELLHDESFFIDFSFQNFLKRVEDERSGLKKYPGISRLVFVWGELQTMEKRMLYDYLTELASVYRNDSNSSIRAIN